MTITDNSGGTNATDTISAVTTFTPTVAWNGSAVYPSAADATAIATAITALMLAAGTIVTGTGPLAGTTIDSHGHRTTVPRFHFSLESVTQLHADIGWFIGALTVALVIGRGVAEGRVRTDIPAETLATLLMGLMRTRAHELDKQPEGEPLVIDIALIIDIFINGAGCGKNV